MAVQFIGFLIVVEGTQDVGLHFGRPPLLAQLRAYWRKRPFWRRLDGPTPLGIVARAFVTAPIMGSGTAVVGEPSLEQRLAVLEGRMNATEAALTEVREAHRQTDERLTASIAKEAEERARGDSDLRDTISETVAGGISLEWLGVIYFMTGMVLSSVAPEVAVWLGHPAECGPTGSL